MLDVVTTFLSHSLTALRRPSRRGHFTHLRESQQIQRWLMPLVDGLQDLWADFSIICDRDPAAQSKLEILFCYPGFHALIAYRFTHWLHQQKIPFLPRFISHLTRFFTGIEIHPAATLGKGLFIDHGMGVVIGETAIVGDYVVIYQGATLGGTGKETGKRHPTLGDHVIVGSGAKILGNITIGDHVRVGAGSIVLKDAPTACTVVGVPGRNICRKPEKLCPFDPDDDSEAEVIRSLLNRIEQLERNMENLLSEQLSTEQLQKKQIQSISTSSFRSTPLIASLSR